MNSLGIKWLLDRTRRGQHWLAAVMSIGLVATSPWIAMRRVIPRSPTIWDYAHLVIGVALAAIALVYFVTSLLDGGWRRHFPWAVGNLAEVRTDLQAIAKLRVPSAGGAGLFSLVQGLVLLLLLMTALTGLGWLCADGSRMALAWREWHMLAANAFAWSLVVHVAAGALHLLEFMRD